MKKEKELTSNWNVAPFPISLKNAFAAICKIQKITVAEKLTEIITEYIKKEGFEQFIK